MNALFWIMLSIQQIEPVVMLVGDTTTLRCLTWESCGPKQTKGWDLSVWWQFGYLRDGKYYTPDGKPETRVVWMSKPIEKTK